MTTPSDHSDTPELHGVDVELLLRQARTFLAFSEQLQPLSTHFNDLLQQEGDWNRTFERYLTELKSALAAATQDPNSHPELASVWAASLELWEKAVSSMGVPIVPNCGGATQEAWQAYQDVQSRYLHLLREAAKAGLDLMEQRLRERSDVGEEINGVRDVYNLWVSCNEETYAQMLRSPEYSVTTGHLFNTLLQCYASAQRTTS